MANSDYSTGSVTLTNGLAVVAGVGTAWLLAMITGGVIYVGAPGGNPLPIQSVEADNAITAKMPWFGPSGTYPYVIVRDGGMGQLSKIAGSLAEYLERMDSDVFAALSGLDPGPNQLAYFTDSATAALTTISAKGRELLDDADASAMLSTLGVSTFIKGLLGDPDAASALARFGVSAFMRGVLGGADGAAVRTSIGAQASLGFSPVEQGGGTGQGGNKLRLGWSGALSSLKAQVDNLDLGRVWTDNGGPRLLATNGFQQIPGGCIIQWGTLVNSSSDYTATLPTAFPNACIGLSLINTYEYGGAGTQFMAASSGAIGKSTFNVRSRQINNGGVVGYAGNVPLNFMAVGF